MEKNVIVTDTNGKPIGSTYPKRAKGLLKHGRAEYVSDREIRLLHAHAPSVNLNTEGQPMSKILEFNARDFSVDTTIEGNCATRVFVTLLGQPVEIFEVGDWRWQWSQILCNKELEPNTDYILRFATTYGMCNTQDEHCRCIITPLEQWEERMEFDLAHSRFQPVLSKAVEDGGLLRVFEIPFRTCAATSYRILFVSQHCVTKFLPAFAPEVYADLPDQTYAELWTKQPQAHHAGGCSIDLSGAVLPADTLRELMRYAGAYGTIDLSGAVISEGNGSTTEAPHGEEHDHTEELASEFMLSWLTEIATKHGTLSLQQAAQLMAISEEQAQDYLQMLMERHTLRYDAERKCYQRLQQ